MFWKQIDMTFMFSIQHFPLMFTLRNINHFLSKAVYNYWRWKQWKFKIALSNPVIWGPLPKGHLNLEFITKLVSIYVFMKDIFISFDLHNLGGKSNFKNSNQIFMLLKKSGSLRIFTKSPFEAKNHSENQIISSTVFHAFMIFHIFGFACLSKYIDPSCPDFGWTENKGRENEIGHCLKLLSLNRQWSFLMVLMLYALVINGQ